LQKKAGPKSRFQSRDFAEELSSDPAVVLTSYPACAACGTHSHFKSDCPKATKLVKAPCYEVSKASPVVPAKPEKKKPSEVKAAAPSTPPAQKKRKQPQAPQQVATSSQVKEEPPETSSSKGKKRGISNPTIAQVGI